MTTALTIAGSDSGGGAGVQADLKTFAAYSVYGLSAVTAVTAQNSLAVTAVHPVPAPIVASQIAAVATDIGAQPVRPDAVDRNRWSGGASLENSAAHSGRGSGC